MLTKFLMLRLPHIPATGWKTNIALKIHSEGTAASTVSEEEGTARKGGKTGGKISCRVGRIIPQGRISGGLQDHFSEIM
jgi:hypothetical protein